MPETNGVYNRWSFAGRYYYSENASFWHWVFCGRKLELNAEGPDYRTTLEPGTELWGRRKESLKRQTLLVRSMRSLLDLVEPVP
jgi:hypothetical protein